MIFEHLFEPMGFSRYDWIRDNNPRHEIEREFIIVNNDRGAGTAEVGQGRGDLIIRTMQVSKKQENKQVRRIRTSRYRDSVIT